MNQHRDDFEYWLLQVRELTRIYAEEKAEARLGTLRVGQSPQDLVLIYKKSNRAADLRGDIAEAHRNVQTYALAALAEQSKGAERQ